MMNDRSLKILYDVCAILEYNTERTEILEKLIKKIISEEPENLDIKEELRAIVASNNIPLSVYTMFRLQDTLLTLSVPSDDAKAYVEKRYFPYERTFSKNYGFSIVLVSATTYAILLTCGEKAKKLRFYDERYQFRSKEEYADKYFVRVPENSYIEKWKSVITFNKNEILSLFPKILSLFPETLVPQEFKEKLDEVINLFSFTKQDLQNNPELRFQEKPIFKIDNDKFILVAPHYLIKNMPQKHELLLRKCQEYLNAKGNVFENMALDLLNSLPESKLNRNIAYNEFELDGILNLKSSSWFVECTSHPPSIKSLSGHPESIQDDLRKTIEKCQSQAIRAIDNIQHPNIARHKPKDKKGILIILEGIYPNLNSNNAFQFIAKQNQLPRYAINYFDLQVILRQPEIFLFEEFLFWRTQENMPIVCFDEKDYWAYFTKMKIDTRMEEAFSIAQKKELNVFYISERFNNKQYLGRLTS
jgi:hypothetical protein